MKRRMCCIMLGICLGCFGAAAHGEGTGPAPEKTEVALPGSLGNLYGELAVPVGDGPFPLVILSHGFGGNLMGNQSYADYFLAQGLAVFNFDFCGGGYGSRSEGSMQQMSVLTEAKDLNAVMDLFLKDARFDRIFLWGSSQGGFVSAYVAGLRPGDVDALVLEFPAFVLQDDAKERRLEDGAFPETSKVMSVTIGRIYNEDAVSFDIYDVIGGYAGDVLILHGDKDAVVPLQYSERAQAVYASAELVVMKGQNHGFLGDARREAQEREAAFLMAHRKAD